MTRAELVFIPLPVAGHITSTVELAKLLVDRDERLSVTVLLMKLHFFRYSPDSDRSSRIKFIDLPDDPLDPSVEKQKILASKIEKAKPRVKEVVSKLVSRAQSSHDSPKLAGLVIDMMLTVMIDVASEFGVPSYISFPSSAAFLGLLFYLQDIHDDPGTNLTETDGELALPGFQNPFPLKLLPASVLQTNFIETMVKMARRFRETKGIIINTFSELEPRVLNVLADGKIPPVYPVGPILNLKGNSHDRENNNNFKEISQWLDDQPPSSVVFLCFGSLGSLHVDQVKEIASALENSGHRFLWSLRKPSPKDKIEAPTDYSDPQDVLPDGFLNRTSDVGRVIGWAPQVDVLAHQSIGGFVSHCGWNSTLESLWFGVPIAAWPLYAEQQLNAFEMVVELGLAVEIKMDYRSHQHNTLSAEDVERGIRSLMDRKTERIKLVKEMSEESKKALGDGGSSYITMGRLVEDIFHSI